MSDARDVVLAAVTAAGVAGSNTRQWQHRVMELVPVVALMLAEDATYGPIQIAEASLGAKGFPAEFIDYEIEEKSKRALLRLRTTPSKRYPEGIEPIRTYPSWSDVGWQQINKVKTLKPGDRLYVYKAMEDKAGQSDGEQVRVLAHFEIVGRSSSQGSSSPAPSADQGDASPVASTRTEGAGAPAPSSPATGPAPVSQGKTAVEVSMEGMSNKQKIAVAKICQANGLTDWVDPSDEHMDKVLLVIQEVRNDV